MVLTFDEFLHDAELVKLEFYNKVGNCNELWFGELFSGDQTRANSVERMMSMMDVFLVAEIETEQVFGLADDNNKHYLCVKLKPVKEIKKLYPSEEHPFIDNMGTLTDCDGILLFDLKALYYCFIYDTDFDLDPLEISDSMTNESFRKHVEKTNIKIIGFN